MIMRFSSSLRRGVIVPLCLLLAGPLHAEPRVPDPAVDAYARARALYQRASQAFEGGHYSEARELLMRAWSLRRSYDVAASLGDTEVRLGMFADAAEHLSYSLRNFPPLENEEALAKVRAQFDAAREQVAALRIEVDQPGADVRIDQRAVGTSPLADLVFVAPGNHVIEARRGSAVAMQEGAFEASMESSVALALAGPTSTVPRDGSGARSEVPLIVGGAVVAVGLTTGVAFHLSASADDDRANGIRARYAANSCIVPAGASADCAALRNDVDGANRAQALSTTGFVIAGVAAVATPIWWLLAPRTASPTSVGMAAFVTPGLSAVTASGRF
jgi:hypothetical protein